jgi:hypothetical protein
MRSIVFSVRSLTSSEARLVAEAYLKAQRNPNKVGEVLGLPDFDKEVLQHPLVRREVIAIARVNCQNYSLLDHQEKLAEIRDLALDDKKYAAALSSEMALAKSAGLYDRGGDPDDDNDPALEPTKLSSEKIRELLAKREERYDDKKALPAPEDEETASVNFFDGDDTFMEDGCP